MSLHITPLVKSLWVLALFGGLTAVATAQNTPSSLMQINGNAAPDASYPLCTYGSTSVQGACDTWNLLNNLGRPVNADGTGASSSPGHSLVRQFIDGTASTDSFSGGGSKDANLLSQWRFSGSPTPNKDTMNAGYAAAYTAPNGDFELMFGADRQSNSGDANIGIWFFQDNVTINNATGGFNGSHINGDIFVISAFTQGGAVPGIEVLKWDTSCLSGSSKAVAPDCADTNLRILVIQASGASCASAYYCAATNSTTTAASWTTGLAAQLFFEGGIDLTKALGGGPLPCFSSFLEETRSSQSTSAVLKDFLLGGFPVCSLSVTKACDNLNNPPTLVNNGTQVLYTWTGSVVNTGVGTLSSVQVNDTLPGGTAVSNPTLSKTTLLPGESATFTAQATLAALTATNTATAQGSFGTRIIASKGTPAMATCSISPSTTVSVLKRCVAPGPGLNCSASGCVVQVPVAAHVCNKGPIQVTNVVLSDNPAANFPSIPVLEPMGTVDPVTKLPTDCADVSASYQPTAFDPTSDGKTNGRFTFTDTISITSATPALGQPIAPALGCTGGALACSSISCPLCNLGECTTTALQ